MLYDSKISDPPPRPTPQCRMDDASPARLTPWTNDEADSSGHLASYPRTTFAAPLAPLNRGRLSRWILAAHDFASRLFRFRRKILVVPDFRDLDIDDQLRGIVHRNIQKYLPPDARIFQHQSRCRFSAVRDGWFWQWIIHPDGGIERTLMRRDTEAEALEAACDLLDERDRLAYESRARG